MLRFPPLLALLLIFSLNAQANNAPVSVSKLDTAIEQASSSMDSTDPALDTLLKIYPDTRIVVLEIEKQQSELKAFSGARNTAYEESQKVNAEAQQLQETSVVAVDKSLPLAELEQLIQLKKSDLKILQNRLIDIRAQIVRESTRPVEIRKRLTELGASLPDLENNLKLVSGTLENGSVDEARYWLAQAQLASNKAEKATLDEELLSQPMRVELLSAQKEKSKSDITHLEKQLLQKEQRSSELRQGEADKVLAAAETAQAKAAGKHNLVQELADKNTVFSAALGERSTAIDGVRENELDATEQAEQSERELKIIERKLEILGMSKTVGEILREQAVRLPTTKETDRSLSSIARLIGDSSLRQMELLDERRELSNVQTYVNKILTNQNPSTANVISDDLLQLTLSRQELVQRAIEVETTYARALSDLDFSVHRLANAVDRYRAFISERLLWVQSRDPLSWSLFSELPQELAAAFAPGLWLELTLWLINYILAKPQFLILPLSVALLIYLSARIKKSISATGNSVGMVRTDSFANTSKSLVLTTLLMCKWPLLLLAFALPLGYHETDSSLAAALHGALLRTALFYLGLEFMRCLLLPGGLVEAHFRWPIHRVANLNKRVVRFEQTFLASAFVGVFFLYLYPTDVGGSAGTFAVMAMLLSMAYFFFRMPHFVQGKVDLYLSKPKVRIHSFWGTLIRTLLGWTPIALIIAVFFGYTYTAIAFSTLIMQTVILFTGLLLVHELGMRWLRIAQRRLRLKVQEELAQANDDEQPNIEDDTLEHDPEMLDDEGTKLLNALFLIGGLVGTALVWADVFPALGILDSVKLWQRTDTVNGEDLVVQTTLGDASAALAIGFLGWIAVRRLPGLLEILLRRKMKVAAASAYAAATICKYALTILILITVLSMLGGSWSQIQWAVAALSLGIGFGLQEIVANFFSGLIILFEQPIRVGDTVTVGDTSGVVTKIEMRATTIRDWDRRELLVPNKEFVTGRLLNWSLTDPIIRMHIQVGVTYGTDMDTAIAVVRQAAEKHPLVLADPQPLVTFEEFGDSSLNISLRYFLEELEQRLQTASAIRLDISRRFKEAGISVAFPQRDVHLDASAPLDIRLVDGPPAGG